MGIHSTFKTQEEKESRIKAPLLTILLCLLMKRKHQHIFNAFSPDSQASNIVDSTAVSKELSIILYKLK